MCIYMFIGPCACLCTCPCTCLYACSISKKNALDDVFWMSLYNFAVNDHRSVARKTFYDILLPFVTAKPLESSLADAEAAVAIRTDTDGAPLVAGDWRSPQKTKTACVKAITHSMHYMLRHKGISRLHTKAVLFALRMEMAEMMRSDLRLVWPVDHTCLYTCLNTCLHTCLDACLHTWLHTCPCSCIWHRIVQPDENGLRIGEIVLRQLSSHATKLTAAMDREAAHDGDAVAYGTIVLHDVCSLIKDAREVTDSLFT